MQNGNVSIRKIESPTLIVSKSGGPAMRVRRSKLLVVNGPLNGKEYMIDKDVFTLGSDPHNDLVLRDSTVSRRHCEIELTSEGYIVRDLGSTNGTVMQGAKIREAVLTQGTTFRLGTTEVVFCPLMETTEYVLSTSDTFGSLVGGSMAMKRIFYLAEKFAPTDATVLIQGETGTGKEVLAEEIHKHSKRRDKPFIVIDCAALTRELIASELFGHVKGSFTGADSDRVGAFEHANGGTVFLDEIGDLDPDLQPKLLRVLEKREIRRIGSNQVRQVNVRIISSTNRRLENEVNAHHIREDLDYRLSVVHIDIPPLRKRKEDLAGLTRKFLADFNGPDAMDRIVDFDNAIDAFGRYDWPGNVRELRNLVEMASAGSRNKVDLSSFLYLNRMKSGGQGSPTEHPADQPFKRAKNELIRGFEVSYIQDLLKRFDGNVAKAAQYAGIERAYLQRLIRKHDLRR